MKLQSAMEYLMTYGWAILIIAVVLGALFQLGVFNATNFAPRVPAGACQVERFATQVALAGECQGGLPQYVGVFDSNGLTSSYVSLPFINLTDESFTVTAWAKGNEFTQPGQSGWGIFGIEAQSGCAADACMHLIVRSDVPYFGFFGDDLSGAHALSNNEWYFFSWVYNRTSNYKYMYLNGAPDSSAASGNYFMATNGYAWIGQSCCSSDMNGSIADVQIYNTSLSPAEVNTLYLEGIGGAPIDVQNVKGWWPLNGNLDDYSGNGNNGQPVSISYTSAYQGGYTTP